MSEPDQTPNQTAQSQTPRCQRIGISFSLPDAPTLLDQVEAAEAAGVTQLWLTQNPTSLDALTFFAAALGRTEHIRLGTSIVPTYPRHPLALAQQAATVAALSPGRLRLGVGPSHRPAIEPTYGLKMEAPLVHLREYVGVLRAALWDGAVDHQGRFFTARVAQHRAPRIPILISALGEQAYRLAGELADGAISWNCPPTYLHDVALPALRAGAATAGRAAPPLVAHVWVALSDDRSTVIAAARQALANYVRLPFYATMFAAAGFPVENGAASAALVEQLVAQGDEDAVARRLTELLDSGLDELLLSVVPLGDVADAQARLFRLVGQLS